MPGESARLFPGEIFTASGVFTSRYKAERQISLHGLSVAVPGGRGICQLIPGGKKDVFTRGMLSPESGQFTRSLPARPLKPHPDENGINQSV